MMLLATTARQVRVRRSDKMAEIIRAIFYYVRKYLASRLKREYADKMGFRFFSVNAYQRAKADGNTDNVG